MFLALTQYGSEHHKNDLSVPIESDAGRIKECLGNVKTLELVLNVVSISGL